MSGSGARRWGPILVCSVASACFPEKAGGGGGGGAQGSNTDAVAWADISGIPADIADGDDAGSCEPCADAPSGPVDLSPGSTLGGQPLLTEVPPVSWTDLDDVPTGLADGVDNDALSGLSCVAGERPVWDGTAWRCSASFCPSGTVVAGDACVEVSERGSDTYVGASLDCDADGRRLCRAQELITACSKGLLSQATDDSEWAADFFPAGTANGTLVLRTTCTGWDSQPLSTVWAYRCCQNAY